MNVSLGIIKVIFIILQPKKIPETVGNTFSYKTSDIVNSSNINKVLLTTLSLFPRLPTQSFCSDNPQCHVSCLQSIHNIHSTSKQGKSQTLPRQHIVPSPTCVIVE